MIGIYKIQNNINHKVYVGKSIAIEQRWSKHHSLYNKPGRSYNFAIYRAFRKYGIENFSFEILETFEKISAEELGRKEKEWINFFDSYNNGYNMTLGGDGKPILAIDLEDFVEIYEQTKSLSKTASVLDCSVFTVKDRLKTAGVEILHHGDTTIQKCKESSRKVKAVNKITKEVKVFDSTHQAANFILEQNLSNVSTHTIIGAINKCINGKTKSSYGFVWSCENSLNHNEERPSREDLKEEIRTHSFSELGRKYGVSDNTIRKWCVNLNLPSRKKDIVAFTDEDWSKI